MSSITWRFTSNVRIFWKDIFVLCGLGKSSISISCLLYTSDAADDASSVDLGGRRIIKKKNFFKQKTAYAIRMRLVGSEMCIRDKGLSLM